MPLEIVAFRAKKIEKDDVVYACNYCTDDAENGDDWWCGKNGLTEPQLLCPASKELAMEIDNDGKVHLGMGFDGQSFYVSKGDGYRVALNRIDGKRNSTRDKKSTKQLHAMGMGSNFDPSHDHLLQ